MRVSRRLSYGIEVLVHLARSGGMAHASDIATARGVPELYLDQILALLRRAGLVASKRGPTGGYWLAQPPSQITLSRVAEAMGSGSSLPCLKGADTCSCAFTCVQREMWRRVEQTTSRLLAATTIMDLARREEGRQGGISLI
jgi:Rrf2 family protein